MTPVQTAQHYAMRNLMNAGGWGGVWGGEGGGGGGGAHEVAMNGTAAAAWQRHACLPCRQYGCEPP